MRIPLLGEGSHRNPKLSVVALKRNGTNLFSIMPLQICFVVRPLLLGEFITCTNKVAFWILLPNYLFSKKVDKAKAIAV